MIANYGVQRGGKKDVFGFPGYFESGGTKVTGLAFQEHCRRPSHWASVQSLSGWMDDQGVPGIEGVDTRALVATIRERGVMMCALANGPGVASRRELKRLLENAARYDSVDFVRRVSVKKAETFGVSEQKVV